MANYNQAEAINLFNQDQVRTATMYEIVFHTPFDKINKTLDRMQVYGQNFTLPERSQTFEDLQYRAYKIPVPTTLEMTQDHSITVYADVRGDLRRALLDWQAACINPDITNGSFLEANRRPTRLGPGDNGQSTITVSLLAPDYQTPIEQIVMYGVRVMKVGGLELSNVSGSISTFGVDFKSVYWEQLPQFAANNGDMLRHTLLGQGGSQVEPGTATNDPMNAPNAS